MAKLNEKQKAALAAEIRQWRGDKPARLAAEALGMSRRSLEGIEQGRGFVYPTLLRAALKVIEVQDNGN